MICSNGTVMDSKRLLHTRRALESLYDRYNRAELIRPDPLQFVYRYSRPADMEIAGFIASCLAYGRVQQIEKDVGNLLERMGASPFEFVKNFDENGRAKLKGFRHRFNTGDDISYLFELLRGILLKFGGIEKFFASGYNPADKNVIPALSSFCDTLLNMYRDCHNRNAPKGLSYLLPRPEAGSACKRLNLFLRWMVRDDEVDAGLWKAIDRSKLVVPVDVHIGRLSGILGFHNRKTISLKTAVEITESFAQIEPGDPVKYDFALSRIGILEDCTGKYRLECDQCELLEWCEKQEAWKQ